ncbi:S8 family serine peptidase [Petrotoga sp. 9PWA.NaAc.5.4]|uniref:S8 family serine peptidase n=1 Tax=Petrotoga sp. 9PWA.NaAc.5.4 TaxID=1434328 RepID=UPI000CBB4D64|nr:S8 family serine peptidase [Petrotoga sp. 9PWA.NaAc.5.4]PNR97104.1 peptidase [Petrotoga sp. 9PWA.NaAc.5.4]
MKKRFSIIVVLAVSLVFIISGCMNLNAISDYDNNLNDNSVSNLNNSRIYIPTFIELQGREYNDNELVVGYEEGKRDEAVKELLSKFKDEKGAKVEKEIPELNAVLIKLDTSVMDVNKAFEIIKNEKIDGIRYIEPNYTDRRLIPVIKGQDPQIQRNNSIQLNNNVTPETTDPFRSFQYALDRLEAETAWASATGEGVIVGLLDTGTDGTHPDLEGQLVQGYDPYYRRTIAPNIDSDSDGHGTHTAGIIAAKRNNDIGISGLAPDAKIMPIRIFRPSYVGDYAVADGIVWAVNNGANVLSNSWGGGGYSNILKDAFDYALMNNVVVVASAGNDTTDQFWHYPSAFTGVIGVAASNARDEVTSFSSRGEYVSVAAPGDNVISSIPVRLASSEGIEGVGGKEPYAYWAGTSMAAPYVSALAALLKEKYPDADVYQIRKMIEEGAEDIDVSGYDTASGYGRINAANSLNLDPNEYKGGILRVEAKTKKGGYYLPGVNITLENKETGKRYYGKTNNEGYELFAWIEPGEYKIIIGGPEYLYAYAPNYRMAEALSYTNKVTVEPLSEDIPTIYTQTTIYTQEFETTQFKAKLTSDLPFPGSLSVLLLDQDFYIVEAFDIRSYEKIIIDLLPYIEESGHYYLVYDYEGDIPEEKIIAKEDFEDGDLEHEFFNWESGGHAEPYIEVIDGAKVLKFGNINDNQKSWVETTFTVDTVASLSFKVKVSSENNYDWFKVYVNNVEKLRLSGEQDWMTYSVLLDSGSHTVRFAYEKDISLSVGEDTAWLDDIVIAKPFGISGEITINNNNIPVAIPINNPGFGFIDEYGGYGVPWTIF